MLTLNEIRNVNFRKANFGGYRAEDVEAFIDEVQLSYDTLLRENAELVKKLEVLAARLEEYQGEEDSIRNALMNAQKVGDASLRDAKHKAELILKDATIKAEKIVSNAQTEILNERDIIERMQRDIADFKTKLLRLYRDHLTLINSLPTEDIMRPDTKSAVESVQMLDRRATEPVYDNRPSQQFPSARVVPQMSEEIDAPEETAEFPVERPMPAAPAAPAAPVMPTGEQQMPAAPQIPQRTPQQRKGGFTVNIDGEGSAPEDNGMSFTRRESRYQPSAPSESDFPTESPAFSEPRPTGFDVPSDDEDLSGTAPASLFKRRGR